MRFARIEMRLTIATIASQIRFESLVQEPLSFVLSATLKSKTDMTMRVRKRGETGS